MSFENVLLPEVLRSVDHLYGSGNWDEGRYGKNRKNLIADGLAKVNAALKPTHLALGIRSNELERVEQLLQEHGKGLEELYRHFEDVGSRELLVKVLCFRLLGHHRVKLPLNTVAYWRLREKARSLICPTPPLHSFGWDLPMIDLTSVGYPLQIYATPIAVTEKFLVRHYAYEKNGVAVRAEENEFVIDAGGCWGDTALFFAHAVGLGEESTHLNLFLKTLRFLREISSAILNSPREWRSCGIHFGAFLGCLSVAFRAGRAVD